MTKVIIFLTFIFSLFLSGCNAQSKNTDVKLSVIDKSGKSIQAYEVSILHQSGEVEILLPNEKGFCHFTRDKNSKWISIRVESNNIVLFDKLINFDYVGESLVIQSER